MFDIELLPKDTDEEPFLNELNMVIVDRITNKGFILNNILPSNAPTIPSSNYKEEVIEIKTDYVCLKDAEDIKECKSYLINGKEYMIGVACGFNHDNDKTLLKVKPCYLGICDYTTDNKIKINFELYVL